MIEKEDLLRAIAADPDDAGARAAYHDRLEEEGDPDFHAEFIRNQLALENKIQGVQGFAHDRILALEKVWLKRKSASFNTEHVGVGIRGSSQHYDGSVDGSSYEGETILFKAGFPRAALIRAGTMKKLKGLLAPMIQTLQPQLPPWYRQENYPKDAMPDFIGAPAFNHVRQLDLSRMYHEDVDWMRSDVLGNIRHIKTGTEFLGALMQSPSLQGLRILEVHYGYDAEVNPAMVRQIAERMPQLRVLNLYHAHVSPRIRTVRKSVRGDLEILLPEENLPEGVSLEGIQQKGWGGDGI